MPQAMPPFQSAISGYGPQASNSIPRPGSTSASLVQDWCQQMGLGEAELQGLQRLGFQVGDRLHYVDEHQWRAAGLRPLEWQRILHADNLYQQRAQANGF